MNELWLIRKIGGKSFPHFSDVYINRNNKKKNFIENILATYG